MRGFPVVAFIVMLFVVALVGAPSAAAQSTGGATYKSEAELQAEREKRLKPRTAGARATLLPNGMAAAPADAPPQVHAAIFAANKIVGKPYRYGGGHGRWEDTGYDCSGSVSYALHGGGLLDSPMPSGSFTSWGESGKGEWITIYTHGGHIYMVVAGLRFDTSGRAQTGSRWQTEMRSPQGFTVRHPKGL